MEDAIPYFHLPDTYGMHYSSTPPQEIAEPAPWEMQQMITPTPDTRLAEQMLDAGLDADTMGSIFSHLKHAVASPFRAAANIADTVVSTPFNIASRIVQTPFNIANRAANAILPGGGGGGGGGGGAPSMPPPDPSPADAPPDGGGDPTMSADASGFAFRGMPIPHPHHHRHHHHHAMTGFGLPSWLHNPFAAPAGKLLISTVPGGATALQAKDIANKALKNGDLKPEHVKAAAALTKAARSGDHTALGKIAKIKKAAGGGDPHAETALDRLKLVDCIQSGRKSQPGKTSTIRHAYNSGLATIPHRRHA